MGEINWKRLALGGLLAGLVMFVCSAVVNAVLSDAVGASMAELGSQFADPAVTPPASAMAVFILEYVLLGLAVIWLYVSIRPRYGPGPLTAAMAGFTIWLVLEVHGLSMVVLTGLTFRTYVISSVPFVLAHMASSIAGASIYQEEPGAPQALP